MNDAQTWTLIGAFGAAMFGALTLSWRSTIKIIDAKFHAVDARFDAVDARFDAVDARFDSLERHIDEKIDLKVGSLAAVMDQRLTRLEADVARIR